MQEDQMKTTNVESEPVRLDVPKELARKQRHFLAVFFLNFSWGIFGADRFYLGKYWTGILKLVTIGGLFVWQLVDFNAILSGQMRDSHGQEMLGYEEYKKFAKRFTTIFTLLALLLAVALVISLYFAITALLTTFQGGDVQQLLQNFLPAGLQLDPESLGL